MILEKLFHGITAEDKILMSIKKIPKKYILIILLIGLVGLVFLFVSRNKNLTINLDFNKSEGNLKYLWQGHFDFDAETFDIGLNKDSQNLLKGIVKYWRVNDTPWEQLLMNNVNTFDFFKGKTLEDTNNPDFYNFKCLDKVLNNVEAVGAKPLINFLHTPKSLIKNEYYKNNLKSDKNNDCEISWQNVPWQEIAKIKNYPPENSLVYAETIKHVIMHYNEGWANGYRRNYELFEIGNEPPSNKNQNKAPFFGNEDEFITMYKTIAVTLRNYFGNKIKIGGAAFVDGEWDYITKFIKNNLENNIPMDFVSFHRYASQKNDPAEFNNIKNISYSIKKAVKEKDNRDITILLDEWGPNIENYESNPYKEFYNKIDYALFQGSVYSILEDTDIDMAFQTIIMDQPERKIGDKNSILNYGIITYHPSKPKPAYYLYKALQQFDETPIKLKTIQENNVYGIAAKGGKEINIILINNNKTNANVNLNIDNLPEQFKNAKYARYELTQDSFDNEGGLKLLNEKSFQNQNISEVLNPKSMNLIKISARISEIY